MDENGSVPAPQLVPYQFPQGQSGNPKGRPKGAKGFTALLRKLLRGKVDLRDDKGHVYATVTKKRAILLKWMEKAMNGDVRAIDKIVTRIDGKPVQPVELEAPQLQNGVEQLQRISEDLRKLVPKSDGTTPDSPKDS